MPRLIHVDRAINEGRRGVAIGMLLKLIALFTVAQIVSLVMTHRLALAIDRNNNVAPAGPTLPCAAIPTKLILEDPICAEKLVRAMNVPHVHIGTNGPNLSGHGPATQ